MLKEVGHSEEYQRILTRDRLDYEMPLIDIKKKRR